MAAKQWNNLSGGVWSVASNWSNSDPPVTGDTATFVAGSYTSTIDTGFPAGTSLGSVGVEGIVLAPTVTLDIQQSIAVSGVVGSTDGTAAQGLLEIGNGATLTYTSQDFSGDFTNQFLYIRGDGVGSAGNAVFTGTLDAGVTLTMDGVNFDATLIADPSVSITLTSGAIFNARTSDAFNAGTIALSGGTANLANIGTLTNTGAPTDQVVQMGGPAQDELLVPNTNDGKNLTIENYGLDDMVGIAGVTSVKSATYDASQHLNFYASSNGTGTPLASLTGLSLDSSLSLSAPLGPSFFKIVTNPIGTFVELVIPCYRTGTRIRTERGEVAVEELCVGDRVPAVRAGASLPVVWIGHRQVQANRHPRPEDVYPVRVAAGAFADFVPHRDLWLSPEHCVFLHGVLVPIRVLINGTSIAQVPCDEVTYWHVELASHDLMLCEGAWAESYLDMGNRAAFTGTGDAQAPDFSRESWEARACQQQERGGPIVAAIRAVINARAQVREAA